MTSFRLPLRVYHEDTDASGVVYHANYLRYFERARSEWVRATGLDQERMMREQRLAFTVASMDIRFLQPARLGDELVATVEVLQHKRASLVFAQTLNRQSVTLSTAEVRVACVSMHDFKPCPLPPLSHLNSSP